MIRTQISLSKEEMLEAKKESGRLGISLAEFLRRSIRNILPLNKSKPWMRFCGTIESGNPNSNQQIDELVYGQKD